MNEPADPGHAMEAPTREQMLSALFANMVVQQANMALMFLGKVPHPETGQTIQDLEAAKMFIDQLEMIEAKTRGNLSKQEEALMRQALGTLQMAFVEAAGAPHSEAPHIEAPGAAPAAAIAPEPAPVAEAKPAPAPAPAAPAAEPVAAEESRKRYSKKY